MIWWRRTLLSTALLVPLGVLTACDDGPAENAGEAIDEAADEAGDAAEEATD